MSTRNVLNAHNVNLRGQGSFAPWVADINDEVYQNLDQLEGRVDSQQNQVNNILNSELPNKQNVLNDHENRLQNSQSQINQILNSELPSKQNVLNDHESRLQAQQNSLNSFSQDLSQKQNQINQIMGADLPAYQGKLDQQQITLDAHEGKIQEFAEKIKTFTKESVDALGVHFGENHDQLNQEKDFWLKKVWQSFATLLCVDGLSVWYLFENIDKIKYAYLLIPINVLGATVIYFIVSQYSQYKKLALEYKNRQVVAQSYLGVLSIYAGDEYNEQKNIITSVVADTLFSRNVTDQGADLPLKEAVGILEAGAKAVKR